MQVACVCWRRRSSRATSRRTALEGAAWALLAAVGCCALWVVKVWGEVICTCCWRVCARGSAATGLLLGFVRRLQGALVPRSREVGRMGLQAIPADCC
jgi:hypothetical protein